MVNKLIFKYLLTCLLPVLAILSSTESQAQSFGWVSSGNYTVTGTITTTNWGSVNSLSISGPWGSWYGDTNYQKIVVKITLGGRTLTLLGKDASFKPSGNSYAASVSWTIPCEYFFLDGSNSYNYKIELDSSEGSFGYGPSSAYMPFSAYCNQEVRITYQGSSETVCMDGGSSEQPLVWVTHRIVNQYTPQEAIYWDVKVLKPGENPRFSRTYEERIPLIEVRDGCDWEPYPFTAIDQGGTNFHCFGYIPPYLGVRATYECSTCNSKTRLSLKGGKLSSKVPKIGIGIGIISAIAGAVSGCTTVNAPTFRFGQTLENQNEPLLYPNPTANTSTLKFALEESDEVSAELYSLNGKIIKSFLFGELLEAGTIELPIDLSGLDKGQYILKVTSTKGVNFSKQVIKI